MSNAGITSPGGLSVSAATATPVTAAATEAANGAARANGAAASAPPLSSGASPTVPGLLTPGEFHAFQADGATFLYLVPSAAIFRMDDASLAVLRALETANRTPAELVQRLGDRFPAEEVTNRIDELLGLRAIGLLGKPAPAPPDMLPPKGFPLTTMVLNVTSKCNLACTYCYEYGDDRIVEADSKPRYMDLETARESVDFMFEQGGSNRLVHLTFFGGETLLNFKLLKSTTAYARQRAREVGKEVDFSLTTNATLLKPEIVDWLAENRVGVTVSIDGPREVQDGLRVFSNGMGSYDIILPKIKDLLARHRTRPIGARVTLTSQNLDVKHIFRHLTEEIGFWEVGFAPVTSSSCRDFSISDAGYDKMLGQFEELAHDFLEHACADRHHGFSNVKDTLEEIHKGVSKAYPCGAGLGLMGVATDGDVALCHRFAGSDEHKIGSVSEGVDVDVQYDYLKKHHINSKTDCRTCWARPICAGGCYHEAHTRYGTTATPNLHFCEWVRSWTDTCLRVYGAISERNPAFLARFDA
ncbi:MAG: quinohemoprotein amine dehydrogenase maturation protein [Gammaproteobacteria bacterium]|nr:quinohemoprotein amine dehydrogenase maturation protein [Gammaproteobacteria bacterium]